MLPRTLDLSSPAQEPQCRLPSLAEFDQGVKALARMYEHHSSRKVDSSSRGCTPPNIGPSIPTPRRKSQTPLRLVRERGSENPVRKLSSQRKIDAHDQAQASTDRHPSPPCEGDSRHVNQKYTEEQGDYIIYALHDKKMKWSAIQKEFSEKFGRNPERTVQGLQAWYYRMNQRIPVWCRDGLLRYDKEDDLEPRYTSIKRREQGSRDKPMELPGLAQRYPERAVKYPWVDEQLKHKARDWGKLTMYRWYGTLMMTSLIAAKRSCQYGERLARRQAKEQLRKRQESGHSFASHKFAVIRRKE